MIWIFLKKQCWEKSFKFYLQRDWSQTDSRLTFSQCLQECFHCTHRCIPLYQVSTTHQKRIQFGTQRLPICHSQTSPRLWQQINPYLVCNFSRFVRQLSQGIKKHFKLFQLFVRVVNESLRPFGTYGILSRQSIVFYRTIVVQTHIFNIRRWAMSFNVAVLQSLWKLKLKAIRVFVSWEKQLKYHYCYKHKFPLCYIYLITPYWVTSSWLLCKCHKTFQSKSTSLIIKLLNQELFRKWVSSSDLPF